MRENRKGKNKIAMNHRLYDCLRKNPQKVYIQLLKINMEAVLGCIKQDSYLQVIRFLYSSSKQIESWVFTIEKCICCKQYILKTHVQMYCGEV